MWDLHIDMWKDVKITENYTIDKKSDAFPVSSFLYVNKFILTWRQKKNYLNGYLLRGYNVRSLIWWAYQLISYQNIPKTYFSAQKGWLFPSKLISN